MKLDKFVSDGSKIRVYSSGNSSLGTIQTVGNALTLSGPGTNVGITDGNDLIFLGTNQSIGTSSSGLLNIGISGDTINLNVSGVTYNSQFITIAQTGAFASSVNLVTISGRVDSISGTTQNLSGQTQGISGQVATIIARTGGFVTTAQTGAFASSIDLATISGRVNSVSGSTQNLSGQTQGLSGQIATVQNLTTNLSGQTVGLSGQIVYVQNLTTNLSGQTLGLSGQIVAVQSYAASVSGSTVNLSGQTQGISGQVANIIARTGGFVSTAQTGQFYAASNPSGFITAGQAGGVQSLTVTGLSISGAITLAGTSGVGLVIAGSTLTIGVATGQFYAANNPSSFISAGQTGVFASSVDLAVISGRVNSVSGTTQNLSGQIQGLSGQIVTVQNLTTNLSGQTLGISGQVVAVQNYATSVSGSTSALSGQTQGLQGQITTINNKTGTFITSAQTGAFVRTGETRNVTLSGFTILNDLTIISPNQSSQATYTYPALAVYETLANPITGALVFNTPIARTDYRRVSFEVKGGDTSAGINTTSWFRVTTRLSSGLGNLDSQTGAVISANLIALGDNVVDKWVGINKSGNLALVIGQTGYVQDFSRYKVDVWVSDTATPIRTGWGWTIETGVNFQFKDLSGLTNSAPFVSGSASSFVGTGQTGAFASSVNLTTISGRVDSVSGSTQALSGQTQGLQSQITTINNKTGTFVTTAQTGAFASSVDLATLSGRINSISGTTQNLSGQTQGLSGQIVTVQNLTTNLSGQTQGISGQVANIIARTGGFVTTAQTGAFASSVDLNTLSGRINSVSGTTQNLSGQTQNLQNQTTALSGVVVFTTGNQTISGTKTFSLPIIGLSISNNSRTLSLESGILYNSYGGPNHPVFEFTNAAFTITGNTAGWAIGGTQLTTNAIRNTYGSAAEVSLYDSRLRGTDYLTSVDWSGWKLYESTGGEEVLSIDWANRTAFGLWQFPSGLTVSGQPILTGSSANFITIDQTGAFASAVNLATISGRVTSVSGTTQNLSGQIQGVSGQVAYVQGLTTNLSGQTLGISGQVANVIARTGGFVTTAQTGAFASSVDLSTLSGRINSISGTTQNLSGQTAGLSGQIVTVQSLTTNLSGQTLGLSGQIVSVQAYATSVSGTTQALSGQTQGLQSQITTINNKTGTFITSAQTGVFVRTGETRDIWLSGFTILNDLAINSPNQVSQNTYTYPALAVYETFANPVTGALVFNTPIARTDYKRVSFEVKGSDTSAGINTTSWFRVTARLSSGTGNIDGLTGAIISANLIGLGDNVVDKWVGINKSGNLALVIGKTGYVQDFSRYKVDVWVSDGAIAIRTGWGWSIETGVNFQFKDLSGLSNSAPFVSGSASSYVNTGQTGVFAAQVTLASLSGNLSGQTVNLSGQTVGLSGQIANVIARTGGFVTTAQTGAFASSVDLNTLSGRINSISGTTQNLSGQTQGLSGQIAYVQTLTTNLSGQTQGISGQVANIIARTGGFITTAQTGAFASSVDLNVISGRVNSVSGTTQNLSGQTQGISGQVANIIARTGGFITTAQTGAFVLTGETRNLVFSGFTLINDVAINSPNQLSQDTYTYPALAVYETFANPVTGALVFNTPITRTTYKRVSFEVRGGDASAGVNTSSWFRVTARLSSGIGNLDGLTGAILSANLLAIGDNIVDKWIGINKSGNLALVIGNTGYAQDFSRYKVDVWVSDSATPIRTGWGWTIETGANFQFKDLSGLANSVPFISGTSSTYVTTGQTGNFVDKGSNQTIGGTKTFSNPIVVPMSSPILYGNGGGPTIAIAAWGFQMNQAAILGVDYLSTSGRGYDWLINLSGQTLGKTVAGGTQTTLDWFNRILSGSWTGVNGLVVSGQNVTTGGPYYPWLGNPSGFVMSGSLGGLNTGSMITTGQTGAFASSVDLATISGRVNSVSGTTQNLSGQTAGLSGQIVSVQSYATSVSGSTVNLSGQTAGISGQVANIIARTGGFVTTAQTGAFASSVDLGVLSGRINSISGTTQNLSGQTQGLSGQIVSVQSYATSVSGSTVNLSGQTAGLSGQIANIIARTGGFVTTAQTGVFVRTGETRDVLLSGFTILNDIARLAPDQTGQMTIVYPNIGAFATTTAPMTGALVFNTPIYRTDNRRVSFLVQGGDSSAGINTTSWFRLSVRIASGVGITGSDGVTGAVTSANLIALGDNATDKWVGINKSGYLAFALGNIGYVQDWTRYMVDVWVGDNQITATKTGWNWTLETGVNFGFLHLSGLTNSAPFLSGTSSSYVTTGQTGAFAAQATLVSLSGNLSGQTQGISGQVATIIARTGGFVTTAQTGAFASSVDLGTLSGRINSVSGTTQNLSGQIQGVSGQVVYVQNLTTNLSGQTQGISGQVATIIARTGGFVTTAQTGAFASSVDLSTLSGRINSISGTTQNLSGQTQGLSGQIVSVQAYSTSVSGSTVNLSGQTSNLQSQITTINNKTGSFVLTGEVRDVRLSGFTILNDIARLAPDQTGQMTMVYPNVGAFATDEHIATGALVFNTPIYRTDNRRVAFVVQGGDSSAGVDTTNWFRLSTRIMSGVGITGSDRVTGAVVSANLIALGDNSIQKWVGINKSGYLAFALGTTGYSQNWTRYMVDVWVGDNQPVPTKTGWSWSLETGINFGFLHLSGLTNSAPFITGSSANFVTTSQTGAFASSVNLATISGRVDSVSGTTQNLSGQTQGISGQVANIIARTGGFVTTAQTGAFASSVDLGTISGRVNSVSGTTQNLSGQTQGLSGQVSYVQTLTTNLSGQTQGISGQVANIIARTGGFVTTAQTGVFVKTGEGRNVIFSGFTTVNDFVINSQNQLSQDTYTYPTLAVYETFASPITGALIFNTPIARTDYRRVSFEIKGGDTSAGVNTTSWFRVTARLSSGTGNIDGLTGAVISANLIALGDNLVDKWIGINKSGNLALVLGSTGYVQDYSRYKVDVWVSDNATPIRTGWGWTIETGTNFQFKDLSGLSNSAPFLSGSTSSYVTTGQTGAFASSVNLNTISGRVNSVSGTTQNLSGQTQGLSGQIANIIARTGGFVTTAQTGAFASSVDLGTISGRVNSISGTTQNLSGQTQGLSGQLAFVITGQQQFYGQKTFNQGMTIQLGASIYSGCILYDATSKALSATPRTLYDPSENPTLLWGTRQLTGTWYTQDILISGQKVLTGNALVNDGTFVRTTGNQIVTGEKTFVDIRLTGFSPQLIIGTGTNPNSTRGLFNGVKSYVLDVFHSGYTTGIGNVVGLVTGTGSGPEGVYNGNGGNTWNFSIYACLTGFGDLILSSAAATASISEPSGPPNNYWIVMSWNPVIGADCYKVCVTTDPYHTSLSNREYVLTTGTTIIMGSGHQWFSTTTGTLLSPELMTEFNVLDNSTRSAKDDFYIGSGVVQMGSKLLAKNASFSGIVQAKSVMGDVVFSKKGWFSQTGLGLGLSHSWLSPTAAQGGPPLIVEDTRDITNFNISLVVRSAGNKPASGKWRGRIFAGGDFGAVSIGEYNQRAAIWGTSASSPDTASKLYINPDNTTSNLYIGNQIIGETRPMLTVSNGTGLIVAEAPIHLRNTTLMLTGSGGTLATGISLIIHNANNNIAWNSGHSPLQNAHILLNNPMVTGHSLIVFQNSGWRVAGIRGSYDGGLALSAGNDNVGSGGYLDFFVSGNYDSTSAPRYFTIRTNGYVGIMPNVSTNPDLNFSVYNAFRVDNTGRMSLSTGAGFFAPSAFITIAGNPGSANFAPIRFMSGTLMATPQTGALEYDGRNLFFTNGSGNRVRITTGDVGAGAAAGVNSIIITGGQSYSGNITFTGANGINLSGSGQQITFDTIRPVVTARLLTGEWFLDWRSGEVFEYTFAMNTNYTMIWTPRVYMTGCRDGKTITCCFVNTGAYVPTTTVNGHPFGWSGEKIYWSQQGDNTYFPQWQYPSTPNDICAAEANNPGPAWPVSQKHSSIFVFRKINGRIYGEKVAENAYDSNE